MVVRVVQKANKDQSVTVTLPPKECKMVGATAGDYVNLELVGNCFPVNKVMIQ